MLLGGAPLGTVVLSQITTGAAAQVPIGWFTALSEPVRTRPGLLPAAQRAAFFAPLPVVPFTWFEPLTEPPRKRAALNAAQVPAFAMQPTPSPFVATGWFMPLSEPVRQLPRSPAAMAPFHFWQPMPSPFVATGWFMPFSEPVRKRSGLDAARQQFLASPSRLLPNPNNTGVLDTTETGDTFEGGVRAWNRVISGEVGTMEQAFTGAQVAAVEMAPAVGASGAIEAAAAPASGAAVPVVTLAKVSIILR